MSAHSMPWPLITKSTWSATRAGNSAAILHLPVSLSRLVALLDESNLEDYQQAGPSQFAFRTAFLLVAEAVAILEEDLPCAPVVDPEGGIRITWNRYNKQIKLVCPANRDSPIYIYQSSPAGNSLRNQHVTSSVLADRLAWLITRESAAAG